jgi:hypothetical protein
MHNGDIHWQIRYTPDPDAVKLKHGHNAKDCVDLQGRSQSFAQEARDEANSDILS